MRLYEFDIPKVTKNEEIIGKDRDIKLQTYRIVGVQGLDAYLKVLDYGDDPGRVVQNIKIYPEKFRGKGYAQKLYIAALKDGNLNERPQFQSEEATRVINQLINKGLVIRQITDGNRSKLMLA